MGYTINNYDYKDTNTFRGLIFPSDFCTEYEGTRNIAERIENDRRFDMWCNKNVELRENGKSRSWLWTNKRKEG